MSQIFHLGPSFYFMQSRKNVLKNEQKLPINLKQKFETPLPQEDLVTIFTKFHLWETNTKQDIHVQKIKVEKLV